MDIQTKYILHLDELRKEAKIKLSAFYKNIVDERTYRRYRKGDTKPSQEILLAFFDRLGLSHDEFYNSFYKSDQLDYNRIGRLFALITNNRLNEAYEELKILNSKRLITNESKRFLELCNIFYEIYSPNPSYPQILNNLRKLIDYPKCTNKKLFSFTELAAIRQIAVIQSKYKKYEDANIFYKILTTEGFMSLTTNNRYFLGPYYASLSQIYGEKGDLELSLEVAEKGIDFSLKNKDHRSLPKLYYFASLCNFRLGLKETAFELAKKSIAICIATGDTATFKRYNNYYIKEQGFTFDMIHNVR